MAGQRKSDIDSSYLQQLFEFHEAQFRGVLKSPEKYRFQVLLSKVQVDTDSGQPRLLRYGYRLDNEYFYPASAIKLCGAVAAIQKLAKIRKELRADVKVTTPIYVHPLFPDEKASAHDHTNIDGQTITLAHEIRKLFLVSDNVAYNRLYTLVGQRTLNQAMWDLGLASTRLRHRLSEFHSPEENCTCAPLEFNVDNCAFSLAPKQSRAPIAPSHDIPGLLIGKAYIDQQGQKVAAPLDFSEKNRMSLLDLQDLLVKVMRRDIDLGTLGIEMDEAMRALLLEAMVQYPSQSSNPVYSSSTFPDDWCKFFLPGLCRVKRKGALRIYNKIGQAYGFTIENSYIIDVETGQDFFLSAVLYTNANEVLNDEEYEYGVADHVMASLAEVVARAVWQVPAPTSHSRQPLPKVRVVAPPPPPAAETSVSPLLCPPLIAEEEGESVGEVVAALTTVDESRPSGAPEPSLIAGGADVADSGSPAFRRGESSKTGKDEDAGLRSEDLGSCQVARSGDATEGEQDTRVEEEEERVLNEEIEEKAEDGRGGESEGGTFGEMKEDREVCCEGKEEGRGNVLCAVREWEVVGEGERSEEGGQERRPGSAAVDSDRASDCAVVGSGHAAVCESALDHSWDQRSESLAVFSDGCESAKTSLLSCWPVNTEPADIKQHSNATDWPYRYFVDE